MSLQKDRMRRRRRLSTVVALTVLLCGASTAPAQVGGPGFVRVNNGAPDEKARHHSIVHLEKTGDLKKDFLKDNEFANVIRTFPGTKVDVMMQQCFGGGFLNDLYNISAAPLVAGRRMDVNFASATAWDQVAWNTQSVTVPGGVPSGLNNFTRAWRDDARFNPDRGGSVAHFNAANAGRAAVGAPQPVVTAVAQDPFSPGGPSRSTVAPNLRYEDPQYLGSSVATSQREINRGPGNQYAVLAAFSVDSWRFEANITRMYRTLRDVYGVPANNIAVIYGAPPVVHADRMQTFGILAPDTDIASNGFPGVYIDQPMSRTNFLDAIAGRLFFDNTSTYGRDGGTNVPGPNDKLFVYTTGHGLHGSWGEVDFTRNGPERVFNISTKAINKSGVPPGGIYVSDHPETIDADGTMLLQVTTQFALNALPTVTIDGNLVVDGNGDPLTLQPVIDSISQIGHAELMDDANLFFYQLQFDHDLFDTFRPGIEVALDGMLNSQRDSALFRSITIRGGDQGFIGLLVPEPATVVLVIVFCLAIAVGRRKQARKSPT